MQSDEQLVEAYQHGDRQVLEELIRRYLKPVYSFVYRFLRNSHDTEDAVQNTFVKAWKNMGRFDTEKKFKTWIFQIAKNTAIDFLRKKKLMIPEELEDIPDMAPLPPETLKLAEQGHWLKNAMKKLSAPYRRIFSLRYNDYFSFREIAEMLGEPINTTKSRHRRGLLLLKKILAPKSV